MGKCSWYDIILEIIKELAAGQEVLELSVRRIKPVYEYEEIRNVGEPFGGGMMRALTHTSEMPQLQWVGATMFLCTSTMELYAYDPEKAMIALCSVNGFHMSGGDSMGAQHGMCPDFTTVDFEAIVHSYGNLADPDALNNVKYRRLQNSSHCLIEVDAMVVNRHQCPV